MLLTTLLSISQAAIIIILLTARLKAAQNENEKLLLHQQSQQIQGLHLKKLHQQGLRESEHENFQQHGLHEEFQHKEFHQRLQQQEIQNLQQKLHEELLLSQRVPLSNQSSLLLRLENSSTDKNSDLKGIGMFRNQDDERFASVDRFDGDERFDVEQSDGEWMKRSVNTSMIRTRLIETKISSCKNLVEFTCDNGKCVPLSRFCDGSDDCGDSSDEPLACTNCNRTLYGQVGSKYPLRVTEPFQRFQPFICRVNFAASGGEYGDIIELTFLSFQIGSFEISKNQTAGCYSGHLTLLEQKDQLIQSENFINQQQQQQTHGYLIKTKTAKNQSKQNQNQNPHQHNVKVDREQRVDEGKEPSNKMIMSSSSKPSAVSSSSSTQSTSKPSSLASSQIVQFGKFCGQMSVRSATYFSEGNNISLIIYVPSRASLLTYSFSLYLTYKFLPAWPAVTRFGPPEQPYELGIKLPSTYCDRVFEDCSQNNKKKCKIRSPNWPGFYNRNITCKFRIRHHGQVPKGHKIRIVISQSNEYKISLFSGSNSPVSSVGEGHSISGSLQSECPLDVVRIYDGPTDASPVLAEFCGQGSLPDIISSQSDMLVVLHSAPSQVLYNSRLELDVQVKFEKIHDDGAINQIGICDYIYDKEKTPSGIISTPRHSIPANTTCSFKFISKDPDDRIWIYFLSYFVQDKHQWSNQERCDVSKLEIYDYVFEPLTTKKNNSTLHQQNLLLKEHQQQREYLQLKGHQQQQQIEHQHSQVYSYCEKTSPKICGRAADAHNHLSLNPCSHPNESYFSLGPQLMIRQQFYKHFDLYQNQRASFSARFEFVNTLQFGNEIPGTLCDREIFSSEYQQGKFESSKNVFLYGRGGRPDLNCNFHLRGNQNQRLRIIIESVKLRSDDCEQKYDQKNRIYDCQMSSSSTNGLKPSKISMITIYDMLLFESVKIACLCNVVSTDSVGVTGNGNVNSNANKKKIIIDTIGSNSIVNFSVLGMSPFEDHNDYGFKASFEFLPVHTCDINSNGLVQKRNGTEGEIQYSIPHGYDFEKNGPLKCRWVIQASHGKHLYLKFKGHQIETTNQCSQGNRFVVYTQNQNQNQNQNPLERRILANVCLENGNQNYKGINVNGDTKNSNNNHLEEFDLLSWTNYSEESLKNFFNESQHSSSSYHNNQKEQNSSSEESSSSNYHQVKIYIDLIAVKLGQFKVSWFEVTKSTFKNMQTGETMRNYNCLKMNECPELNACIPPELWCDGTVHCPSGYDESAEHCSKFPTLLIVSIGSLILIISVILISVITIHRFNRKRKSSSPATTHTTNSRVTMMSIHQNDIYSNHNNRPNHHDLDYYIDYHHHNGGSGSYGEHGNTNGSSYPRLGSELNFSRVIREPQHRNHQHHNIDYYDVDVDQLPMEITHSFVSHYHNNVF